MSTFADELRHLKSHVKYPANRSQVIAACNNMMDVPQADRDWFSKTLPEGNYKGPEDVIVALMKKL